MLNINDESVRVPSSLGKLKFTRSITILNKIIAPHTKWLVGKALGSDLSYDKKNVIRSVYRFNLDRLSELMSEDQNLAISFMIFYIVAKEYDQMKKIYKKTKKQFRSVVKLLCESIDDETYDCFLWILRNFVDKIDKGNPIFIETAIRNKSIKCLEQLHNEGFANNDNIFLFACSSGNIDILKYCIVMSNCNNIADYETTLKYILKGRSLKILQSYNGDSKFYHSHVLKAIKLGSYEQISYMIDNFKRHHVGRLKARPEEESLFLYKAVHYDRIDIYYLLLSKKIKLTDYEFKRCIKRKDLKTFKALLDLGNPLPRGICVDAILKNNVEFLDTALNHGAELTEHYYDKATEANSIEVLNYLSASMCPLSSRAYVIAAMKQNVEGFKKLHSIGTPWPNYIFSDSFEKEFPWFYNFAVSNRFITKPVSTNRV